MVEVYIDGASAGNPGLSGAGIFVKRDSAPEYYSIPIGMLNNHQAEFKALILGLELCLEHQDSIVSFRSDSSTVVDAVENAYTKNKQFSDLLEQALTLIEKFDLFFIKWVPSKDNKVADELARKAIHKNGGGRPE